MKRNGFTLVEMMAVIVLVALLAVIGVATYTNVNESAKEKTLETKREHIRASALKWAKENNISNKTIISVNALVVEGYLTAEENEVGKIGVIENPITGENMICNTVDISLKDGEYIAVLNDNDQNCTLATQSLVDTNINIKVVDESNIDKTGSGSISAWSNKNVMIIVSSSSYDSRATSISYDFEGNTVTKPKSGKQKYTGNAYLSEGAANNYYNVFHVSAALLLNSKIVVTYNIAGESSKSRSYTIRIDKEEATASVSSNSEWLTVDKDVYVTVDDGKGSGPKYFYISKDQNINNATRKDAGYKTKIAGLEIGKYYIWTEDIAGNKSSTFKVILELNNVDKTEPACEVLFHGHEGNNGWYKEVPVTPGGKNTVKAGISGMNIGINTTQNDPEYTVFAQYNTFNEALGPQRTTNTSKSGVDYYCHVKTLAGNYANAKRTLKLDMTPPTIKIDTTSDTNYTQIKSIKLTVADGLSGLPERLPFRWGWSKSQDCANLSITEFVMIGHQLSDPYTSYIYGPNTWFGQPLTGKYYLCIDFSQITDYAGNHATSVNGSGGGGRAIFGPYYFDNTPPTCDGNNGKTNWTTGGYTINQLCADNDGTNDQSGCKKRTYTTVYYAFQNVFGDRVTIEDNAGNTTVCDYNVYIDNETPACGTNNGKSNWTRGSWTGNQYCTDGYSGCARNPFSYTWTSSTNQSSITISDNVGHTRSCPISVRLDTDAPKCTTQSTQAEGSWTNGTVTLTGVCSDTGGSGCKPNTTASFSDQQAQAHRPANVADNAGNEGECAAVTVRIDKTKPTCSVSKSNTGTTSGVTTSITASDYGGSQLNTGASASGESGVKSSKTYTVYDYAGNAGTCDVSVSSSDCEPHDCNCQTCTGTTCVAGWTCTGGYSCGGTAVNSTVEGSFKCSMATTKSGCEGNMGCSWSCGGWTCNGYNTYDCNCQTCYNKCYS